MTRQEFRELLLIALLLLVVAAAYILVRVGGDHWANGPTNQQQLLKEPLK